MFASYPYGRPSDETRGGAGPCGRGARRSYRSGRDRYGREGLRRLSARAAFGPQPESYGEEIIGIEDALEMIFIRDSPRAVAARPRGHGAGTPAAHPERARRSAPATSPPAWAAGRRRSAPRRRWCGGERETVASRP